jgi:hypothetical protein
MVGSAEFSGTVLGIRSRANTSAQRSAVARYTHAYRIDYSNIISPLRRPGPSGLADFAITVETYAYTAFSPLRNAYRACRSVWVHNTRAAPSYY